MKKYRSEDNIKSETSYRNEECYTSQSADEIKQQGSTTNKESQETYTKEKGRRLTFGEFLIKYKLNDVDKSQE